MRSNVVLETRSLSRHFGGVVAVDRVDFSLRENELRCLIGPNGAGKSTFFHILLGIVKGDYGDIFLNGVKITNLPIHERSKLGISYLPQQTSIFRGLTVFENLMATGKKIFE